MSRARTGAAIVGTAAVFIIASPTAANAEDNPNVIKDPTFSTVISLYDLTPITPPQSQALEEEIAQAAANVEVDPLLKLGPSKWQGRKLRHPEGGAFYPEVVRWANLVKKVMKEHDIPDRYLEGILAQIQQESSGNPDAVNDWDSNARNGDPSKGLLQVIGSTYKMHAKEGYENRKYQTVPYTNLHAALYYVKSAYGMGKFKGWNKGANQGY